MLLSGVYFTLESAPRWLQLAVTALPLSPYLKALRAVFNDGAGLGEHASGLALVGLWSLLAFTMAVKRFRWT
jgi:ABC-2 type transport system permease protein